MSFREGGPTPEEMGLKPETSKGVIEIKYTPSQTIQFLVDRWNTSETEEELQEAAYEIASYEDDLAMVKSGDAETISRRFDGWTEKDFEDFESKMAACKKTVESKLGIS